VRVIIANKTASDTILISPRVGGIDLEAERTHHKLLMLEREKEKLKFAES